ncbi:MAG: polysaccharide lyase beta-sandwich domain-containing protein [Clostridia bacterium]|nr:polysaccharide lyase beta-sandwich domain-containing protein [Clostridia bacterium]
MLRTNAPKKLMALILAVTLMIPCFITTKVSATSSYNYQSILDAWNEIMISTNAVRTWYQTANTSSPVNERGAKDNITSKVNTGVSYKNSLSYDSYLNTYYWTNYDAANDDTDIHVRKKNDADDIAEGLNRIEAILLAINFAPNNTNWTDSFKRTQLTKAFEYYSSKYCALNDNYTFPKFSYSAELSTPKSILSIYVLLKINLGAYYNTSDQVVMSNFESLMQDNVYNIKEHCRILDYTAANRAEACEIYTLAGAFEGTDLGLPSTADVDITTAIDALDDMLQYRESAFDYTNLRLTETSIENYANATIKDGFYQDGSFIQHGSVGYTANYGRVLIISLSNVLFMLKGQPGFNPNLDFIYTIMRDTYMPIIINGYAANFTNGRKMLNDSTNGYGKEIVSAMARITKVTNDYVSNYSGKAGVESWIKSYINYTPASDLVTFYKGIPLDINPYFYDSIHNTSMATPVPTSKHYEFANMDKSLHVVAGSNPFSFAVSKSSERIKRFESIGSDKGAPYGNSGMTYLYNNGDNKQYNDDYWQTAELTKLPGITVPNTTAIDRNPLPQPGDDDVEYCYVDSTSTPNPSVNVSGGVTFSGVYGVSALNVNERHNDLNANKSWFMFDNEIVALGSAISYGRYGSTSDPNNPVLTILENRKIYDRQVSDNKLIFPDGWNNPNQIYSFTNNNVSTPSSQGTTWFNLQTKVGTNTITTGYYFPDFMPPAVHFSGSEVPDSTKGYYKVWLNHGTNPSSQSYSYVILPNQDARLYAQNPNISVLTKSDAVHSVYDSSSDLTGIVFWRNLTDSYPALNTTNNTIKNMTVSSDKKAIVMYKKESNGNITMTVSDPTMLNTGNITLTLNVDNNTTNYALQYPGTDTGVSLSTSNGNLVLTIPVNNTKGKSINVKLVKN